LSVWYEARLLEEGIEDMQSLATVNFVDVILHTRVPVGRCPANRPPASPASRSRLGPASS